MFVLKANVNIENYKMDSIHSIHAKKSIHEYTDSCEIKIPASARLKQNGQPVTKVETAKMIREGNRVVVNAGYNDEMNEEFKGFVSRVNFTIPCSIECEGYSWQLRNKSGIVKSWKSTTLQEVLEYIIEGTDIVLSKDIPDVPIVPMYINNQNGLQVLDWLKSKMMLTAYFIDGNILYVGLQETTQLDKSVKYRLGWNTIKDNQLKFRHEDEVRIRVKAICKDASGRLITKEFGQPGGLMRTVVFGRIDDMSLLEEMAIKKAQEFRYSGYEGNITTFLQPYCQPGWKAELIDDQYQERQGDYIIESVETKVGMSGGRRVVEIGKQVSKQK